MPPETKTPKARLKNSFWELSKKIKRLLLPYRQNGSATNPYSLFMARFRSTKVSFLARWAKRNLSYLKNSFWELSKKIKRLLLPYRQNGSATNPYSLFMARFRSTKVSFLARWAKRNLSYCTPPPLLFHS